jgi:hypothetical protein
MILTVLALASAAANGAPPSDNPDNKVRCVREAIIGSLVGQRRVCHTVGEWRAIQARASDEMYRTIQPGTLNEYNNDPKPTGG